MDGNNRTEEVFRELERRLQQEAMIAQISQLFLTQRDYDAAFDAACRILGETTAVSRVYVFENHDGNHLCSNTVEWCGPGVEPVRDQLQDFPYQQVPYWKESLEQGRLIRADSIYELPPKVAEVLEWQGIKSVLVVPLTVMGRWEGFLGFDQCHVPRTWTDTDVAVLETAARLLSSAMEKRLLEQQLAHTSRLSAVGALSAGIAHEFNNIHAGIMGLVELALEDPALPTSAANDMNSVLKLVNRAVDLTRKLKALTKRSKGPHLVDLLGVVRNALAIMERDFVSAQVEVSTRLELPTCFVVGDTAELGQVVLNLLMNAIEAVKDEAERRIRVSLASHNTDFVRLAIEDSGPGIPQELHSTVFEPFFTTRGKLGGGETDSTGLGLAICSRIVAQHKGTITVHSSLQTGTVFEVVLPVANNTVSPGRESEPREEKRGPHTSLRVGILDDEPQIREVLERLIQVWGHQAFPFGSLDDALEEASSQPFDAFIVDLLLPGGGTHFIRQLEKLSAVRRPAVIVLTGLTSEQARIQLEGIHVYAVLEKPVQSFENLRRLLEESTLTR